MGELTTQAIGCFAGHSRVVANTAILECSNFARYGIERLFYRGLYPTPCAGIAGRGRKEQPERASFPNRLR